MKLFLRALGSAAVLMALQVAPANATIMNFTATLAGTNEVPANGSPATGSIFVTLDDVLNTLTVHETFSGLIGGNATGAHIHCCAAAGSNAGVAVNFIGKGFPLTTSGTYDHTFNLLTDLTAAVTLSQFIAGLEGGLAYANIHDTEFGGGEIRGQLMLVQAPEPASLLMFGLGAGLLGFMRRRRAH